MPSAPGGSDGKRRWGAKAGWGLGHCTWLAAPPSGHPGPPSCLSSTPAPAHVPGARWLPHICAAPPQVLRCVLWQCVAHATALARPSRLHCLAKPAPTHARPLTAPPFRCRFFIPQGSNLLAIVPAEVRHLHELLTQVRRGGGGGKGGVRGAGRALATGHAGRPRGLPRRRHHLGKPPPPCLLTSGRATAAAWPCLACA